MSRSSKILSLLSLAVAILLPLQLLADTSIDYFAAKSSGDNVTVEWKTGAEQNISKFDIERAPAGSQQFSYIGTVQAKGSYSYYSYVDETGFQKALTADGVYQYRIKIYNTDGSFKYSQTTSIEHSTSGIRRTWGQIKEMFR